MRGQVNICTNSTFRNNSVGRYMLYEWVASQARRHSIMIIDQIEPDFLKLAQLIGENNTESFDRVRFVRCFDLVGAQEILDDLEANKSEAIVINSTVLQEDYDYIKSHVLLNRVMIKLREISFRNHATVLILGSLNGYLEHYADGVEVV